VADIVGDRQSDIARPGDSIIVVMVMQTGAIQCNTVKSQTLEVAHVYRI